jgi:hypothetical protein
MDQQQLLAHPEAALQDLGLDALQLGVAFEQGLKTRRVLDPQRLPEGKRLVGGFLLARGGRLRLARVTARELGVQETHRLAHQLGDSAALARGELRLADPPQLVENFFVIPRDIRYRKSAQPRRTAVGIGEGELAKGRVALRLHRRDWVGHHDSAIFRSL